MFMMQFFKAIKMHFSFFGLIGWIAAPFIVWFEKYIFNDWDFVGWMLIMVVLDSLSGIMKALRLKTFSSSAFGMVFKKISLYAIVLIAVHGVTSFLQHRGVKTGTSLFGDIGMHLDSAIYASIMFRELWSIHENLAIFGIKLLPNFVLKYMKDFDEYGKYQSNTPPVTPPAPAPPAPPEQSVQGTQANPPVPTVPQIMDAIKNTVGTPPSETPPPPPTV